MTTNRMGLTPEQSGDSLTNGDLENAIGLANNSTLANVFRELLAYRKAGGEPVGYTSEANITNLTGRNLEFFSKDKSIYRDPIALFRAAPPLQAVRVPDSQTDDERNMEIEGISVVKLPPELHSEHGVVVQLEKVMAALAVHGIKYERRHQKVVGLRAGIDAVRAEGIDVDAEKINAEKCHK